MDISHEEAEEWHVDPSAPLSAPTLPRAMEPSASRSDTTTSHASSSHASLHDVRREPSVASIAGGGIATRTERGRGFLNEVRFFGFDPLGWIDDVYNANGDIIADSVDAFEDAVAREVVPLAGRTGRSMAASRSMSVGRAGRASRDRSCSVASRYGADASWNEENSKLMDQVKDGCDKLLHALHAAFDKNFDKFELYCLRNILSVPDQAVSRLVASEMAAAAPPAAGAAPAGALPLCEAGALELSQRGAASIAAGPPGAGSSLAVGGPVTEGTECGPSGHPRCPSVADELATAERIAQLREQVVHERRRRRALMTVKAHYERVLPRCEGVAAKLQRVPELVRTTVSALESSSMPTPAPGYSDDVDAGWELVGGCNGSAGAPSLEHCDDEEESANAASASVDERFMERHGAGTAAVAGGFR